MLNVSGNDIARRLETAAPAARIRIVEPMSRHTTFGIGGAADAFVEPTSVSEVVAVMRACRDNGIPVTVMGNGSNLLVSDLGIRGAVIRIGHMMGDVSVAENVVAAQAGASNANVARAAADAGLAGLEFLAGIPGSIGGSLAMNAGAFGSEIGDNAVEVLCLDRDLGLIMLDSETCGFRYRGSHMLDEGLIILSASFKLKPEPYPGAVRSNMEDLMKRRSSTQPHGVRSAGSVFKRPGGDIAAAELIDRCGLKGMRVGGASVSLEHAGFVVNDGDASVDDVRRLMDIIRDTVYRDTGVMLEPEIRMLGFDQEAR